MNDLLQRLLRRLADSALGSSAIIPWGSPIPVFGNLYTAKIATLGINPSNREFVDGAGNELEGKSRRFQTLRSLDIAQWSDATDSHIDLISTSCLNYFSQNPYDRWFKRLDTIISGTATSYYHPLSHACHYDLVPYATESKWSKVDATERKSLLSIGADTLGEALNLSEVRLLILNGKTVVHAFQRAVGFDLPSTVMREWSLPRRSGDSVVGIAYSGMVSKVGKIRLTKRLRVVGFNHNIQSSYGVPNSVCSAIAHWIAATASEENVDEQTRHCLGKAD